MRLLSLSQRRKVASGRTSFDKVCGSGTVGAPGIKASHYIHITKIQVKSQVIGVKGKVQLQIFYDLLGFEVIKRFILSLIIRGVM